MDTVKKKTTKKIRITVIILIFCAAIILTAAFITAQQISRANRVAFEILPFDIGAHLIFSDDIDELETMDVSYREDFSNTLADSITLSLRGERMTNAAGFCDTVGELLEANGIVLLSGDVLSVPTNASLAYGMHITIDNYDTEIRTEDTQVPFDTVVNYSQTVPKGKRVLVEEGQYGKAVSTIEVSLKNGEEFSSRIIDTKVTVPAVSEVYEEGIGGVFVAPDGTEYNYSYYLDVSATAYGEAAGTHTYTGKRVEIGMIAVDPNYIPLGSNVYVIGSYGDYGVCAAEDIGGGIKGHKIDVYLHDEDVVRKFGIRKMRAYVLE